MLKYFSLVHRPKLHFTRNAFVSFFILLAFYRPFNHHHHHRHLGITIGETLARKFTKFLVS